MQVRSDDAEILAAIPLEAGEVIFLSVDLHTRGVVYDEVDELPGFRELDLADDRVAGQAEACAGETLRQALARGIRPVADPLQARRKPKEDSLEVDPIESPGVQRPVETGHSDVEWLVEHHPNERVDEGDCGRRAAIAELAILPVEYDAARIGRGEPPEPIVLRAHPGRVHGKGHVKWGTMLDPTPEGMDQ